MRRAEEEPEGAGVVTAPVRRRLGGRLLVPLVVAGAVVVVLSTAVEGRAHLTPFFGSATQDPLGLSTAPPPPAPSAQAPAGPMDVAADPVVQTVLTVLAFVVAAAVAALLIRLIVVAVRARRRTGPRRLRAAGAGEESQVADAPTVLRGIAAALVGFDEHREPSDAIVQAWLGLQQAAEDAGFARSAAETPTEFTGRVLSRTGADRVALRTLLRLYLRARFGDGELTAADVTDAREALRALEASWERA